MEKIIYNPKAINVLCATLKNIVPSLKKFTSDERAFHMQALQKAGENVFELLKIDACIIQPNVVYFIFYPRKEELQKKIGVGIYSYGDNIIKHMTFISSTLSAVYFPEIAAHKLSLALLHDDPGASCSMKIVHFECAHIEFTTCERFIDFIRTNALRTDVVTSLNKMDDNIYSFNLGRKIGHYEKKVDKCIREIPHKSYPITKKEFLRYPVKIVTVTIKFCKCEKLYVEGDFCEYLEQKLSPLVSEELKSIEFHRKVKFSELEGNEFFVVDRTGGAPPVKRARYHTEHVG